MKWLSRVVVIAATLFAGVASAALIQPELVTALASADPDRKFPVEFFMKAQANARVLDASIDNLPRPQRRARVAQVLSEFAARTQQELISYLNQKAVQGKVDDIRSLWLVNMVSCWATKDVIQEVAARDDIELVLYARVPVELGKVDLTIPPAVKDNVEPNLITTNARGAWKQGYTGQGIVIGVVDTGVRYTHLDLRNHLWTSPVYPNPGFNFASNQYSSGHPGPSPYDTLTPLDYYGHGTHCAGITSADGSFNGDTMGVAPSAKVMSVPVDVYLHSPYPDTSMENNTIAGMQFCVSPPRDPTNGADVITMSLGLIASWLPRRAVWRAAEVNIEAAGIVHCVAAGNEGPTARTIRTPGDCPPPWPNPANHPTDRATSAVITVGATDNNDNAASFTSIGPSDWGTVPPYNDYAYPPGLMDPDICMPGVNIYSTSNSGDQNYEYMSGTSMATPGAAGVVALMLSKNPNLTPRKIDSILEMHSVRDLGPAGKDVTFGAGRVNCSLAVAMTPLPSGLQLLRRTIDDVAGGNGDGIVNPGEAINVPTWILNMDAVTRYGVVGKITKRVADPLYTITDSVKSFGNIPAYDSATTGSDGFEFSVSGSATNGHILQMDLTLRDAADSTWVIGFDFVVGTPVLAVTTVIVKDSVGGNGNGRLDPGESAELIVLVRNNGEGNAYNVTGLLASSNPAWLGVSDPNGTYGTIPHGATGNNNADRYGVWASAAVPPGTTIPCTLHLSATGYSVSRVFGVVVGFPPQPPGTVIWGPKQAPGMPGSWGLYGLGYDYVNDVLYATYHGNGLIYKYSSDSMLTFLGTIPTPHGDTGCHDIKYCAYDNTLWLHNGETYTVDKIDLNGNLLRSFPTPAGYPTGLAWDEASRKLYIVDRRNTGSPGRIYVYDTLGNQLASWPHPCNSQYGPRCAAIERSNTNPRGRTLINMFTWCLSGAPDSAIVYELDTITGAIYNTLRAPDVTWNMRGVEYDPRDGSFWIGIMQNIFPPPYDNSILKVYGFYIPTALSESPIQQLIPSRPWIQAHPNPFRTGTRVTYSLPAAQKVAVRIYDASGREVRTLYEGPGQTGEQVLTWDGRDAANREVTPGIYFARCEAETATANSKLIYLK